MLDGDPTPPPLKRHTPNFRPMSVVAKRLDELRCHLVWRFDGDPTPPRKKRTARPHPILAHVYCGQTVMDEDATWYGSRPQPGHSSPPLFSAHVCCGHGRPPQLLLSTGQDLEYCTGRVLVTSVSLTAPVNSWTM